MTHSRDAISRSIIARPLTQANFARYGDVIQHAGSQRRRYIESAFEHSPQVNDHRLWVSNLETETTFPFLIRSLERHEHAAQSFIPLTRTPYVVIVASSLPDGQPDLEALEAFIASPEQGVCYRRGVWHHGLTVLEAPAQFAIFMGITGQADDEFLTLAQSAQISVVLPE